MADRPPSPECPARSPIACRRVSPEGPLPHHNRTAHPFSLIHRTDASSPDRTLEVSLRSWDSRPRRKLCMFAGETPNSEKTLTAHFVSLFSGVPKRPEIAAHAACEGIGSSNATCNREIILNSAGTPSSAKSTPMRMLVRVRNAISGWRISNDWPLERVNFAG